MFRRYSALALLVVLAVASVAGCSKKEPSTPRDGAKPAPSSTTPSGAPVLVWTVEGVDANGTQPPADDVVAAVKTTLDAYLAHAVVGPLHSGAPSGDLSPVLSPAALERLAADAPTRATLVDEGMPPATKAITAESAKASLSSVAGPDGSTALVAARLELKLRAVGPKLDVDIVRYGDVVLAPEADGWRIDSFRLRVDRNSR